MELSKDLISQFVKTTNDNTKEKKETTIYGKIVEQNDSTYVKLDGSDQLTPVISTAEVKNGERVTVMMKNHTAIVTGNISSPAARIGTVTDGFKAVNSTFTLINSSFEAVNSRFESVDSTFESINSSFEAVDSHFEAVDSTVNIFNSSFQITDNVITGIKGVDGLDWITTKDLSADHATIGKLHANYADIDFTNIREASITNLFAQTAMIDHLNANYANIDFANITDAHMENFYAKSGLIEDVHISDGSVTGILRGVKIYGDVIEANTIAAKSLMIQGKDGIFYRLNTDGREITTEKTEWQTGLDGSIIIAESVDATKIKCTDLSAFNATIGGLKITDGAIYSFTKTSVDNTTNGIYLDSEGQVNFGDAMNFITYYKDANGNYKLDISAESITFGTSKKDVAESIDDASKTASNYLNFDSNGLVIGDMLADTLGNNVLIDSDSVDIRNGDTVYASYGANTIYLGKNSNYTKIDLCNGSANMYRLDDGAYGSRFLLQADTQMDLYASSRVAAWARSSDNQAMLYIDSVNTSASGPFASLTTSTSANTHSGIDLYNARVLLHHTNNGNATEIKMEGQSKTIMLSAEKIIGNGANGYFVNLYKNGVEVSDTSHTHSKLVTTSAEVNLVKGSGDFYYLRPNINVASTNYLGHPDHRWTTIYAENALNTSSDIRLKENISKDMDKYIAMLDLLDPISYNWISESDNQNRKTHIGYGAQYVWKAMSDVGIEEKDFAGFNRMISENESGPVYGYSLCLEEFIPILHAKIKQLENRIVELERKD